MTISLRSMKRMPLWLGSMLVVANAHAARPEAQPVPSVDLDRYTGRWYELSRTPNLFEAFYFRREGGIGLGLAVVQTLVAAHGGDIEATDSALGGALFRIRLPRRHDPVSP